MLVRECRHRLVLNRKQQPEYRVCIPIDLKELKILFGGATSSRACRRICFAVSNSRGCFSFNLGLTPDILSSIARGTSSKEPMDEACEDYAWSAQWLTIDDKDGSRKYPETSIPRSQRR